MADLIISIKTLKTYYKLKKFKDNSKDINLNTSIEIVDNLIILSYSISSDISDIIIPAISLAPPKGGAETQLGKRMDDLWKTTCFEVFLASKTKKSYIELNLSPSLDYNIYSFSGNRLGMKEEESLKIVNIEREVKEMPNIKGNNSFSLKFTIISNNTISINDLLINISSVIKYSNGNSSYYAINHGENKADFHDKRNFVSIS